MSVHQFSFIFATQVLSNTAQAAAHPMHQALTAFTPPEPGKVQSQSCHSPDCCGWCGPVPAPLFFMLAILSAAGGKGLVRGRISLTLANPWHTTEGAGLLSSHIHMTCSPVPALSRANSSVLPRRHGGPALLYAVLGAGQGQLSHSHDLRASSPA